MTQKRKSLSKTTRDLVLHEAGYKCGNPVCRTIITLDIHHLVYVSEGGSDDPQNLLALCPNCHSLHHAGHIPIESLRAWKFLLLSLNEGFDKRSVDILLALAKLGGIMVWGDGLLQVAALIASSYVASEAQTRKIETEGLLGKRITLEPERYWITLTTKGRALVDAWRRGDQTAAVGGTTVT
jgi:hypothetical protein